MCNDGSLDDKQRILLMKLGKKKVYFDPED